MTEASGDSLAAEVSSPSSASVFRPIPGNSISVLTQWNTEVPVGGVGEITIGGASLARGYRERPEETKARFIPSPLGGPDPILFRTGDLGRRCEDGRIEILGRIDRQLKVRGVRVEPEEIEVILASRPDVADAAVDLKVVGGRKLLVAYVVARADRQVPDSATLRSHCAAFLPAAAVPSQFVTLLALPRTLTGKVDRSALPTPALASRVVQTPVTPQQSALRLLFEELTKAHDIGLDDSFFEIGGDSLLAAQLCAEIEERWGLHLPVSLVFENPTVGALAEFLTRSEVRPCGRDAGAAVAFLFPGIGGPSIGSSQLCREPGLRMPLVQLDYPDWSAIVRREFTFEALADHLVAQMKNATTGPVTLVGYSFGGLVAASIAARAQSHDLAVDRVILIDSAAPGFLRSWDHTHFARLGSFLRRSVKEQSAILLSHWPFRRVLQAAAGLPRPKVGTSWQHELSIRLRWRLLDRWAQPKALVMEKPVVLIRAERSDPESDDLGWRTHCRNLTIIRTAFDHETIMGAEGRSTLVRALAEASALQLVP